jgi:spermidine/putrescine transport system permease protein
MSGANLSDGSERSPVGSVYAFLRERPSYRRKLIVLPPVVVLTVFFLIPGVTMLYYSLRTGTTGSASFTIANYAKIAQSVYGQVIWRTTVLTVQTTVFVTIVGYALAYSTIRFTRRSTLVLLLVILPFWTNYIIRMYAWINILQQGGALGSLLQAMNLVQEPTGFLYTGNAVLIGFSYIWLPLAVLPFYATLSDLDEDLIEAAKDLGSGPIKTFFTVTLPLTKDGLIAGIILVAIPTFGSFITPALLGGTNVTMVGMVIESQFNQAFNWPFGSALGIFVSALVVVLLLVGIRLGGSGFFGSGDVE